MVGEAKVTPLLDCAENAMSGGVLGVSVGDAGPSWSVESGICTEMLGGRVGSGAAP